jgi:hypothetical protein
MVTIEQCDLQRTVKLNDKKKLYYIEPFAKDDEIIDDDVKTAVKKDKAEPVTDPKTRKGGTITMWYNITDTGERKKMNGFTARHVWTYQKMKPSADACYMKDSMIIKTDGWYIDLPQFNCPVHYRPQKPPAPNAVKPECEDKFVMHRSGKGKLGFPLTETMTMFMAGQTSEFKTSMETVELSTLKLDSMLFEIPPGYTETKNESDLQDDYKTMIKEYEKQYKEGNVPIPTADPTEKKAGMLRIGVFAPTGDQQVTPAVLQQELLLNLRANNIESIAVTTEQDAREKKCDYILNTEMIKVKQASKVGGLLKAIKNADPTAGASFNIEASLILKALADGSVKTQQSVSGKYEGKVDEAGRKAMDEGSRLVMKSLSH